MPRQGKAPPTFSPDRAFRAHLAEYEAVRAEIEINFAQQDRLASYALALTTGATSLFFLGTPPVAVQQPFLLLVASLLLTAIGWALVETSLTIQLKSRYLLENLAPRVQALIGPADRPELRVFRWSESVVTFTARSYFHLIMAAGKYATAFVPSVALVVVFFSRKGPDLASWPSSERILFVGAIAAMAVVAFGPVLKLLAAIRKYPARV
jgi:hypothetical protein